MADTKYRVINLDQQDLINKVCESQYASGYASGRNIGEEGYIELTSTQAKDKDLQLYYLTIQPQGTSNNEYEWWADGSARHLYHISELEKLQSEDEIKMSLELLSWVDSDRTK